MRLVAIRLKLVVLGRFGFFRWVGGSGGKTAVSIAANKETKKISQNLKHHTLIYLTV